MRELKLLIGLLIVSILITEIMALGEWTCYINWGWLGIHWTLLKRLLF